MREIILNPLKGISIKNVGEICFGLSKDSVKSILGRTEEINNQLYYYNVELRIDFNEDDKVEFIECLSNDKIKPIIYEKEALSLEADELVSLLKSKNKDEIYDSESGYSYSFFHLSVGIYRDFTPNAVEEMILEMKQDNTYEDNKEWLEEEYEKSKFFNTIGIGVKGYYNK